MRLACLEEFCICDSTIGVIQFYGGREVGITSVILS